MSRKEMKYMREKIKCEGEEQKDYGGEIKGMKAKEENKRLRWKIKGAENAEEGKLKNMRVEIKCEGRK